MRNLLELPGILLLATAVAGAAMTTANAGAKRTRSSESGSSTKVSARTSSGTRTAARGPTRTARGRATYGYHHRGHGHHGHHHGHRYYPYHYYPHYYYRWYPGYYSFWGWPYVYYGYYGYGYPHSYRAYNDDTDLPAVVQTEVRPKRAAVLLDGVEVGQARDYNGTWDKLYVQPGSHVLEFRAPGYRTLRVLLTTRPGGRYIIEERLQKGEGLDPRSAEAPERPAGPYASQEGTAAQVEPTAPARGERQGGLRRGLLRIDVQPPDAAVYLDGRFLARADELSRLHGAIPLAQGTHTLEAVRPGYEGESVEVTIEGREPVEVRLQLGRKAP